MFEYIDSDALSTEDKILSFINDLEDARNAITMLIDESEDDEVASSLENADEKMAEVIENLDKAVKISSKFDKS